MSCVALQADLDLQCSHMSKKHISIISRQGTNIDSNQTAQRCSLLWHVTIQTEPAHDKIYNETCVTYNETCVTSED